PIWREETELVAAEACMQIFGPRSRQLLRDDVVGAHLLAEERGDALDDPVADRVAERVVVPLEPGDIDQPDGAPAAALFEREQRFERLRAPAEGHQVGFAI